MNCPVCRTTNLHSLSLAENLPALACAQCRGHWLAGARYWSWLEQQGANLPELPPAPDTPASLEDERARLCPECRLIMVKYRVGHETGFMLDQCGGCKGIWFDGNEWEILKSRNLHDDIPSILTAPWQLAARREESQRSLEHIYRHKFGAEDYAEIKRIKRWLDGHEKKQELLAYLSDTNPLDA